MNKTKMKGGAANESNIFNAILCRWWLLAIFFISIMVGIVYIIYKINLFDIGKKFPYKSGFIIGIFGLFLASTYAFIYNLNSHKNSCNNFYATNKIINKEFGTYLLKFFSLLGIIGLIIGLIFWIYYLFKHSHNFSILMQNIFIVFSVIIGLAIFYSIFESFIIGESKTDADKQEKQNKFFELFKQIFFFIPCLLIEFVKYIEYQFNITTKPVWILLLLELIIIVLYFLIPIVLKSIVFHEGKEILKGPVYTNNLTNLGTYQNLTMTKKLNYNYNYGLSFSLYINPQPASTSPAYTKYTSLFNYANKPNILYNAKKNILKIVFQNNKNDLVNIYEMKNPSYQKWMKFVINYNSGNVDIFIDNNLVASKTGIAPYMTLDNITAGSKNGINGGIKNVLYFNKNIPNNKFLFFN